MCQISPLCFVSCSSAAAVIFSPVLSAVSGVHLRLRLPVLLVPAVVPIIMSLSSVSSSDLCTSPKYINFLLWELWKAPVHFLVECHKVRLNQNLSVLGLILVLRTFFCFSVTDLCLIYFAHRFAAFFCLWCLALIFSTSASDWLKRFVSKITIDGDFQSTLSLALLCLLLYILCSVVLLMSRVWESQWLPILSSKHFSRFFIRQLLQDLWLVWNSMQHWHVRWSGYWC